MLSYDALMRLSDGMLCVACYCYCYCRVYSILDDEELQALVKQGDEWSVRAKKVAYDINSGRAVPRIRSVVITDVTLVTSHCDSPCNAAAAP